MRPKNMRRKLFGRLVIILGLCATGILFFTKDPLWVVVIFFSLGGWLSTRKYGWKLDQAPNDRDATFGPALDFNFYRTGDPFNFSGVRENDPIEPE